MLTRELSSEPVSGESLYLLGAYGHAIKQAFGDLGFTIWNEWSKNYANYSGEKEARRKWEKDLKPRLNRPITVASIYKHAQQEGWIEDARSRTGILNSRSSATSTRILNC
jgi:hypothetical protein